MAPGSSLMVAERGSTKKKIEIVKSKGPADVFGPGSCICALFSPCLVKYFGSIFSFHFGFGL